MSPSEFFLRDFCAFPFNITYLLDRRIFIIYGWTSSPRCPATIRLAAEGILYIAPRAVAPRDVANPKQSLQRSDRTSAWFVRGRTDAGSSDFYGPAHNGAALVQARHQEGSG